MIKYVDIQNLETLCSSLRILATEMYKVSDVPKCAEYDEFMEALHNFQVAFPNQAHKENIFDDIEEDKFKELDHLATALSCRSINFANRNLVFPRLDFSNAIKSICFSIEEILEK